MNKLEYCELHSHLGASLNPEQLWTLAHEQGLNINMKNFWDFDSIIKVKDPLEHEKYLEKFHLTQKIQSSYLGVRKSMYCAVANAYIKSNITQIEIRFNPMLRNQKNMFDLDQIILSAAIGIKRACLAFPVKAGIILETGRDFDGKLSAIIAEKAVKYKELGIVGFDMSGSTHGAAMNFENHQEAFSIAKAGGLGITCHAGELAGSSDEIFEVIERYSPNRLGHGIRVIDSDDLMKEVSKRDITLEICPTSNLATGCVKGIWVFRDIFKTLVANNIKFTINSDGPEFLDSYAIDEFRKLKESEIIEDDILEAARLQAFKASFIK